MTLTKGVGRGLIVHGVNNHHCAVIVTKAGTVGGGGGEQLSLCCDTDQGIVCWRVGGGVMGSTAFTVLGH